MTSESLSQLIVESILGRDSFPSHIAFQATREDGDERVESFGYQPARGLKSKFSDSVIENALREFLALQDSSVRALRVYFTMNPGPVIDFEIVEPRGVRGGAAVAASGGAAGEIPTLSEGLEVVFKTKKAEIEKRLALLSDSAFGIDYAKSMASRLKETDYCPVNGMGRHSDGFSLERATGVYGYTIFFEGSVESHLQTLPNETEFITWLSHQSIRSLTRELYLAGVDVVTYVAA